MQPDAIIEQIIARPDDLELRLVLADQLQQAGDPRGELMALHCAIARATGDERARLRKRVAELFLMTELGALDRDEMRVEWRHGFVSSAKIFARASERLPELLAHPALRLVEELSIAAERDELPAIGEAILGRPQPSLLRTVVAGPPGPDRDWIARADAAWLAPLVAILPDLATLPASWMTTGELDASLARRDVEIEGAWVTFDQLAPELRYGWARLAPRPGAAPEVARLRAGLPPALQQVIGEDDDASLTIGGQIDDPVSCARLYQAVRELAPHVEDARFAIGWRAHVLELAIRDGRVEAVLGTPTSPHLDATYDYWDTHLARRPHDDELRDYVLWQTLFRAQDQVERLPTAMPEDRARARVAARQLLDRAAAIYDEHPRLWELRGQLARELGELDEAARCFTRVRELGAPGADFDLALAAFALHDDARAGAHLARLFATAPDHTAARLLAAHVAPSADERHRHLEVLGAAMERRRIAMTPFAQLEHELWPQLEPDLGRLVQTGRYRELVAGCVEAAGRMASRIGAAAHLLAWAEYFHHRHRSPPQLDLAPELWAYRDDGPSPERVRAEAVQDGQKAEAGRLADELFAAAAAYDPLAGCVHQRWAQHTRELGDRAAARGLLEQGLAINPHHLELLDDLAMMQAVGEAEVAAELYERYVELLRVMLPYEGRTGRWCPFPIDRICEAYYGRTCMILYGAPAWDLRRALRPDDDALAKAEATLARVEPALREVIAGLPGFAIDTGKLALAKAVLAAERGRYDDALAGLGEGRLERDALAWALRAHCLHQLGRHADAIEAGETAVTQAGRMPNWPAHHAIAYAEAALGGDRDAILERLAHVLHLWPDGAAEIEAAPVLAALRELPAFHELVRAARGRPPGARDRWSRFRPTHARR